MLSKTMQNELNEQINAEFQSAYAYAGLSAYCHGRSLSGFGHWFQLQAQEELHHAQKICRYVLDRGAELQLLPLKPAKTSFSSMEEVCRAALDSEVAIHERLDSLAKAAFEEGDSTTYSFLQWFLGEQVEEISTAQEMLDKARLVGQGEGLYLLDREARLRKSTTLTDGIE